MPLNAVRVFEAAARYLSFTRAGDELCVTHGAVSRQIQVLEDWLGAPLFRRLNRSLELTDAGRYFFHEISGSLDRIAVAGKTLRERRHAGLLRVNSLPTFTMRWLIPRLSDFQIRNPHIEVRLTTSSAPIEDVGAVSDVYIRGGPESHADHLSGEFLGEYRTPACAPTLLERRALRHPVDLKAHTLLHSAARPALWSNWLALAGVPGLRPAHTLTLEHFYLTIQAAIDGLGIAIGPSALVATEVEAGRLLYPFPATRLPSRSYYWYRPRGGSENPLAATFCDWLAERGKDEDGLRLRNG